MTPWEIHGRELANCNCSYGCPCQFNALPTHGNCEAAGSVLIERGFHGDVSLDGLVVAALYKWPGPVHEGNGAMQIIIDERATPEQRQALERIATGEDTEDMATMWWIFHAMCSTRHETLFRKFDLSIDVDGRRGHVRADGVFETKAEPIRNPVTGAEHRVRIDLPEGFEYTLAEIGSGDTTTMAGSITLEHNKATYAQFARLHLSGNGVIQNAT